MIKPEDVVLEEIDKMMNDLIDRIFQLSQENLIDKGKVDTANLLKSGNIQRKFLEKQITYSAPYADSIEFGRSPGQMPPVDALMKWVSRKLGVSDPKEARSVAWAVATAIKQRGIDPSPYILPAFEQAMVEFKLSR